MTPTDADRWDQRYAQDDRFRKYTRPRPFLVENAGRLPPGGLVLDAAMGLGGNAGYLITRGMRVVGVDISSVAVKKAKSLFPGLMAVRADLAHFRLPARSFDAILNFYYLERKLWPQYRSWLRPGGLLVFETLTREMLSEDPGIEPVFLLEPGELRLAFSDLDVLVYREGWESSPSGHRRATASLVASLPL